MRCIVVYNRVNWRVVYIVLVSNFLVSTIYSFPGHYKCCYSPAVFIEIVVRHQLHMNFNVNLVREKFTKKTFHMYFGSSSTPRPLPTRPLPSRPFQTCSDGSHVFRRFLDISSFTNLSFPNLCHTQLLYCGWPPVWTDVTAIKNYYARVLVCRLCARVYIPCEIG